MALWLCPAPAVSPFLFQKHHILRGVFQALLDDVNRNADEDSVVASLTDSGDSKLVGDYQENSGLCVEDDIVPAANKYAEFKRMMWRAMEIFEDQEDRGYTIFLDKFVSDTGLKIEALQQSVINTNRFI